MSSYPSYLYGADLLTSPIQLPKPKKTTEKSGIDVAELNEKINAFMPKTEVSNASVSSLLDAQKQVERTMVTQRTTQHASHSHSHAAHSQATHSHATHSHAAHLQAMHDERSVHSRHESSGSSDSDSESSDSSSQSSRSSRSRRSRRSSRSRSGSRSRKSKHKSKKTGFMVGNLTYMPQKIKKIETPRHSINFHINTQASVIAKLNKFRALKTQLSNIDPNYKDLIEDVDESDSLENISNAVNMLSSTLSKYKAMHTQKMMCTLAGKALSATFNGEKKLPIIGCTLDLKGADTVLQSMLMDGSLDFTDAFESAKAIVGDSVTNVLMFTMKMAELSISNREKSQFIKKPT
jgi:hypothetical protein